MKNVILFIAVVILFGCKGKEKPPVVVKPLVVVGKYPKYVHDTCSGQWAVQTEPDLFFGSVYDWETTWHGYPWPVSDYAVKYGGSTPPKDSLHAFIGWEFQYSDTIAAGIQFNDYLTRHKRSKFISDSLSNIVSVAQEIEKKRKDSIFKCQHTYQ